MAITLCSRLDKLHNATMVVYSLFYKLNRIIFLLPNRFYTHARHYHSFSKGHEFLFTVYFSEFGVCHI